VVWLLTGFWHGAAWNFIAWGLYFGLLLMLEKFIIGRYLQKLWQPLQHIYALLFIVLGWLLFRAETLSYALSYLTVMFGLTGQPLISNQALYYIVEYKFEFLAALIASMPVYPLLQEKVQRKSRGLFLTYAKCFMLIALFGLCIMYLINSTFNPFIYFRF
jgi:alginate O-acetyltransferase complex protein AlgI